MVPTRLLALQAEPERYASYAKLRALLVLAAEELPDAPLYYNLHDVAKTIRVTAPPADTFRSALFNAGARSTLFPVCTRLQYRDQPCRALLAVEQEMGVQCLVVSLVCPVEHSLHSNIKHFAQATACRRRTATRWA